MVDTPLKNMFVGTTPEHITQQLTDKNYHVRDFPRDSQDKAPATGPVGPVARANEKTHQYELFICAADVSANGNLGGSRSALAAGQFHFFRASFAPAQWELYAVGVAANGVDDVLYFAVGSENVTVPYEILKPGKGISDIRTVAGRGTDLAVWTPSTNAAALIVSAKAVRGLSSTAGGGD